MSVSAEIAEHVWHPRRPSIFTPAPLQTGKYLSLKTDGYLSVTPPKSLHHMSDSIWYRQHVLPYETVRVHLFLFWAVVERKQTIRAQGGA